ncbi:hypothetical protein DSAG12_02395 [Promethearchaeum syntrophicum]|uniref:Uncharacterized protein n=1 Tax=Promethearchaeum syntrophicum TaxID=2594042 RepID=A0A5B9DC41_9ARCH|nr:hypothetical protein [Candidatus Prometheoarchaeum syntrophicum]QEE16565.1 hypothetical protein DSAG12_02395 [Candidatus Prometheoarchaeum syntrophicum]
MHVNNKIYYHIQRKDPNQPYWKIGEVLTVPAGPKNNFIESVLNKELLYRIVNNPLTSNDEIILEELSLYKDFGHVEMLK